MEPTATLLFSEIMMPSRNYHRSGEPNSGEPIVYDLYSTLIKANRPDGKDLFIEKLVIEPPLSRPPQRNHEQL